MKILMTSLALMLLASAPVYAQSSTGSTGGTAGSTDAGSLNFSTLDADRSGDVSQNEFTASGFSDEELFGEIDADQDGSLTNTELSAWSGSSMGGDTGTSDTGPLGGTTPGTSGATGGTGGTSGMGSSGSGGGSSGQ